MKFISTSRRFRTLAAPALVCGFALAACSSDVTEPLLHRRASDIIDSTSAVTPTIDTVTVDWTTITRDENGGASTEHETFKRFIGNVQVKHGESAPTMPERGKARMSMREAPLPVLTVEEPNTQTFGPWTKSQVNPDRPTQKIELSGEGAGPASVVRAYDHDTLTYVIKSQWIHGVKGWDLISQEVEGNGGRFQSRLTVAHANNARPSLLRGKPALALAQSFTAASARRSAGGTGFEAQNTVDDCVNDKCKTEKDDRDFAIGAYLVAAAAVDAACISPAVFVLGPCEAALATYAAATWWMNRKINRYNDCVVKATIECRKCYSDDAATPFVTRVNNFFTQHPTNTGARKLSGEDCNIENWTYTDDPGAPGGAGGNGDETCYWYIEWDETGALTYVEFLGCFQT